MPAFRCAGVDVSRNAATAFTAPRALKLPVTCQVRVWVPVTSRLRRNRQLGEQSEHAVRRTCSLSSFRKAEPTPEPRILVGSSGVTRKAPCWYTRAAAASTAAAREAREAAMHLSQK